MTGHGGGNNSVSFYAAPLFAIIKMPLGASKHVKLNLYQKLLLCLIDFSRPNQRQNKAQKISFWSETTKNKTKNAQTKLIQTTATATATTTMNINWFACYENPQCRLLYRSSSEKYRHTGEQQIENEQRDRSNGREKRANGKKAQPNRTKWNEWEQNT